MLQAREVSFLSVMPRYYGLGREGDTVFDVAGSWTWNLQAIGSLALLGHTVGEDTLCHAVKRMPANIEKLVWDRDQDPTEAQEALKAAFRKCVDGRSAVNLSLSAGYDSRLLLALCISEGIEPRPTVMGPGSTDAVIAAELCNRLGLKLEVIELSPSDYLAKGTEIARVTSGVKTAINWHTYLYSGQMDNSAGVHLVGSNGEFARSFYFDSPRLNVIADHGPAALSKPYWLARFARRMGKFSKHNPLVGWNLVPGILKEMKVGDWGARRLATNLDAFYEEQRVRHFIGSGLACYREFSEVRSPFLDEGWIRAIARLGREHKRNNRYHRELTRKLLPQVNDIPYNRMPNGEKGKGYSPFADLAQTITTYELIAESPGLEAFASRAERIKILEDIKASQLEERSFWLTLHFASEALAGH